MVCIPWREPRNATSNASRNTFKPLRDKLITLVRKSVATRPKIIAPPDHASPFSQQT